MLGVQHLSKERVAGQISQKVALIQILLHLQADASDFGQAQQQLAKLVGLSGMALLRVLHQSPVDPLLSLLHLPAALHRLHICRQKEVMLTWQFH